MGSNTYTISEAMNTMTNEDRVFIATYNPSALKDLCCMWSLELQLEHEGKHQGHPPVILKTLDSQNRFVYLWYKFKEWLFFKLLKMVSKR